MSDKPLNDRQNALLGYVATIAFDRRVRGAKSAEALLLGLESALKACIAEDLPAVAEKMAEGGVKFLLKKAEPFAEDLVRRFFDGLGRLGTKR